MHIILYSDAQIKSYATYAKINEKGINDRLLDHIFVLDQIYDYAVKNSIKYVVFGGDGLDDRTKVSVIDAKEFLRWKQKLSANGITQLDCVGNHDLTAKSNNHNSLELFGYLKNVKVIDEPRWEIIDGKYGVYFIPFMHRLEDIKHAIANCDPPVQLSRNNCIAVMHYGIYDVKINGHLVRDEGCDQEGVVGMDDLEPLLDKVEHIYAGHYHCNTNLSNRISFIGPPIQHNWGEKTITPRFLDIDMKTGNYKVVETKSPRFIDFESAKHIVPSIVKDNFVRVKTDDAKEREILKEKLEKMGARYADIVLVPKQVVSSSPTAMNLSMSFVDMGKKLVQLENPAGLDHKKLETILEEALKEAAGKIS